MIAELVTVSFIVTKDLFKPKVLDDLKLYDAAFTLKWLLKGSSSVFSSSLLICTSFART